MRFSRKRKDKRKEKALTGIGLALARVQGDFRSKTTRFHRRSASYLMLDAALTRKASEQWRVSQRAIQSRRVLLAHHVNGPTGRPPRAIARSSQRLRPDPMAFDEPRCAP